MKKLILFSGVLVLGAFAFITPSMAGEDCTRCKSGSDECTRVMVEGVDENGDPITEIYVFIGKQAAC
ncbi:hypothetical protein [Algoriphagus sp.]|uniref:hypothetical protein n=1 Tax=Algoriphagus sp. TaxID=1872435 RepID=UPI003296D2E7